MWLKVQKSETGLFQEDALYLSEPNFLNEYLAHHLSLNVGNTHLIKMIINFNMSHSDPFTSKGR